MMGAYRHAFGAVLAPDAPENVRVSDEQRQQIETIFKDFATKARDYMGQHKDQLQAMRPKGTEDEKARAANRAAFEEILKNAPKPKDAFNQAWALLNPAQQAAVKERLDKAEARMSEQRQERYVDRRARQRGGPDAPPRGPGAERAGPGGPGGPGGPRGDQGPMGHDPRRERLMDLLSRLSPEQQDALIRRLESRRDAGPDGGPEERRARRDRPDQGRGQGRPHPAPPMDELDVPPPAMPEEPRQ